MMVLNSNLERAYFYFLLDPTVLTLVGSGSNGIEEMKKSFSIDHIQYGLLRTTIKVDLRFFLFLDC